MYRFSEQSDKPVVNRMAVFLILWRNGGGGGRMDTFFLFAFFWAVGGFFFFFFFFFFLIIRGRCTATWHNALAMLGLGYAVVLYRRLLVFGSTQ